MSNRGTSDQRTGRRRTRRAHLAAAGRAGLSAVLLTACGTPGAAQPGTGGTKAVVRVPYLSPQDASRQGLEQEIFDDFNRQHANVQVDLTPTTGGWDGVYEK